MNGSSPNSPAGTSAPAPSVPKAKEDLIQKCTRTSATLAQTTLLLDPQDGKYDAVPADELATRVSATTKMIQKANLSSIIVDGSEEDDVRRLVGKVDRALERTRRAAVKFIDSAAGSRDHIQDVRALLEVIVDVLEEVLRLVCVFISGHTPLISLPVRNPPLTSSAPHSTPFSCSHGQDSWSPTPEQPGRAMQLLLVPPEYCEFRSTLSPVFLIRPITCVAFPGPSIISLALSIRAEGTVPLSAF